MPHDEKVQYLRNTLTEMKCHVSPDWYNETERIIDELDAGDWKTAFMLLVQILLMDKENRPG